MSAFTHLKVAALSDVGRKRKNNEDAFGTFPEAGIFCVADGMGGGDDGEIASAAVVRAIEETAGRFGASGEGGYAAGDVGNAVSAALSRASAWICNRAHERKLNGCGSTFVGVVFDATDPAQALAVHAGDSRLYLLHGRSIRQITRDHSVAELMGEKDESKVNPMFRSMVVNGIGIRPKADPEFTPFKVAAGDRVLICSDGLSRMVPDKAILSVSRAETDPEAAVRALVAAALEAGGIDNVTAVLIEVGALPPPAVRLEAPREPAAPEDAETADDPTSEGGTTGKTGETETLATLTAGLSEAPAFGERDEDDAEKPEARKKPGTRSVPAWILGVLALAAVLLGLAAVWTNDQVRALFKVAKPQPVGVTAETPAVSPKPSDAPTDGQAAVVTRTPAPVVREAPVSAAIAPKPGTDAAPARVAERKSVRTAAVAAGTVAVEARAAAPRVPDDPGLAAFAAVCEEKVAKPFVQTLRRLCPKEEMPLDFDEEAERFLKSARRMARQRGRRDAEAAAVDLRVLILNVEAVRGVLTARRAEPEAAAARTAWDEVMKGDPSAAATQAACVRLVKAIVGVRIR